MNTPEFIELVRQMREAQKRYFAKRDNLEACKALERRVDQAIVELAGEPQLFGPNAECRVPNAELTTDH